MPPKRLNRVPPKVSAAKKQPLTPTQTLLQQQLQLNSLQVFRQLQQQQKNSKSTLVLSFFLLLGSLVSVYLVFHRYGLIIALAVATVLYRLRLMSFLDLIINYVVSRNDMATYSNALRRADIMSEPITKKVTEKGENEYLAFASSCMQGWRRSMEDSHTNVLLGNGGFFGVYDGHSGAETAKFCGANMYDYVARSDAFSKGDYTSALHDGFISLDKHLHSLPNHEKSGCTACVLYFANDQLYCANAGDSRCVLCRNGEAFPLSNDHKPYLESEQARIERAGGYIWNRRVNGILALSRAIGDFGFKKNTQLSWDQQSVTSSPEVRTTHLNRDTDEFAVIACDGIWDMRSNEQVVEFVRNRIQQRFPLNVICEQLMDTCLSPVPFGLGCDNMSVIIVQFKRHSPAPAAPVLAKNGKSQDDGLDAREKSGILAAAESECSLESSRSSLKASPKLAASSSSNIPKTNASKRNSPNTLSLPTHVEVERNADSRIVPSDSDTLSESQQSEMDQLREFVSKSK